MTTRFVLARHASCALTDQVLLGRTIDVPLDPRGRREAEALARHIAAEEPARVLSGPRLRALQTAQAIAALARAELRVSAELDEIDFGEWSGQPFTLLERDPRWRRWNAQRATAATPAGVGIAVVQRRAVALLERLAAQHRGATLALVTHAEVIRSILLHYLHMPLDDWYCIEISPASLTVLSIAPTGVCIDRINAQVASVARVAA